MTGNYYVYILASKRNGTLYIGVTNNLERRISEHKSDAIKGFTAKYGIHLLVHHEAFSNVDDAIGREKGLKNWTRKRKMDLIEESNPDWRDLSGGWDTQVTLLDSGQAGMTTPEG